MGPDDYSAFVALMKEIALVTVMVNGKDLADLIPAFFNALKQYPLAEVKEALYRCAKEMRFFPMLADITERIPSAIDAKTAAQAAWPIFLNALNKHGYYNSVRFPHPAFHYAIKALGGWMHVHDAITKSNMEWYRRAFERDFAFAFEHGITWDNVPGHLAGYYERQNALKGYTSRIFDAVTGDEIRGLPDMIRAANKALPIVSALTERMRNNDR